MRWIHSNRSQWRHFKIEVFASISTRQHILICFCVCVCVFTAGTVVARRDHLNNTLLNGTERNKRCSHNHSRHNCDYRDWRNGRERNGNRNQSEATTKKTWKPANIQNPIMNCAEDKNHDCIIQLFLYTRCCINQITVLTDVEARSKNRITSWEWLTIRMECEFSWRDITTKATHTHEIVNFRIGEFSISIRSIDCISDFLKHIRSMKFYV